MVDGFTNQEIADQLGINRTTLYKKMKKLGLEDSTRGLLGCVEASFDSETYRIMGGQRQFTEEDAQLQLDWTDFTPVAEPDDDTKG